MSYQTSSKRSPSFWLLIGARFSGTNQKPERRLSFGTGLVRHCPQGLFSPFFTFLRAIYFSARLDFSSSPLSAPGSPRMSQTLTLSDVAFSIRQDKALAAPFRFYAFVVWPLAKIPRVVRDFGVFGQCNTCFVYSKCAATFLIKLKFYVLHSPKEEVVMNIAHH